MNIVYWMKGARGIQCLRALLESGYSITALITHENVQANWRNELSRISDQHGISIYEPEHPNSAEFEETYRSLKPDLSILGGYGKILRQNIIDVPSKYTINLHGGKLPEYRGSSPLNWALINGEPTFSISIIKVDSGVDTGDILLDRTFEIDSTTTIRDVHDIANRNFPEMLIEVVRQIEKGNEFPRVQSRAEGAYYPLRFPEDGFILWDQLTAEQIHNRIRALTDPYPCAFTFYRGKKVKLMASELAAPPFHGESGRIYRKTKKGLLVCAVDCSLWITQAVVDHTQMPLADVVSRYDKLATIREAAHSFYAGDMNEN